MCTGFLEFLRWLLRLHRRIREKKYSLIAWIASIFTAKTPPNCIDFDLVFKLSSGATPYPPLPHLSNFRSFYFEQFPCVKILDLNLFICSYSHCMACHHLFWCQVCKFNDKQIWQRLKLTLALTCVDSDTCFLNLVLTATTKAHIMCTWLHINLWFFQKAFGKKPVASFLLLTDWSQKNN